MTNAILKMDERPAPIGFSGTLLYPGEAGYDDARSVFNGMIDRRPAVIARCTNAADVAACVDLARVRGLALTVYCGGHGVTGSAVCDGGLCVDLREMTGITVDPVARTVRAEGGLTWGAFDAATAAHGLAVTGGRISGTGVGGLSLGSGSGWLERKIGFTCDNLIAAEVVTADGRLVRASEDENPDLFWGLRGGGGNFGIVTAFHFRLHPIEPLLLAGMLLYPGSQARDVLRHFRDFMKTAPDEVGAALAFVTAPPADFVPEAARGKPVVALVLFYNGPVADGERVFAPLRAFGPPAVDLVQPMPYVTVQSLMDEGNPKGLQNYWTADFFDDLPDAAIDVLVEHGTNPVSPMGQVVVVPAGGAIARVPEEATAFSNRNAAWNIHFLSMWADPADTPRNIAFTKTIAAAMKPFSTGKVYLNFIGDEGQARVAAAYGPEKYTRLQALKKAWDPQNLFRHNQNITPG